MLQAFEKVSYRITDVLHDWVDKEGGNLQGFMDNPSGHVDYNPYMIVDFTALQYRLDLLRKTTEDLYLITEFKKGNPDITRSMHDTALDRIPVQLTMRLEQWLEKRKNDMEQIIQSSGNSVKPAIEDYSSLYSFNQSKFIAEYTMYANAYEGVAVVTQYKLQQSGE